MGGQQPALGAQLGPQRTVTRVEGVCTCRRLDLMVVVDDGDRGEQAKEQVALQEAVAHAVGAVGHHGGALGGVAVAGVRVVAPDRPHLAPHSEPSARRACAPGRRVAHLVEDAIGALIHVDAVAPIRIHKERQGPLVGRMEDLRQFGHHLPPRSKQRPYCVPIGRGADPVVCGEVDEVAPISAVETDPAHAGAVGVFARELARDAPRVLEQKCLVRRRRRVDDQGGPRGRLHAASA